MGVIGWATGFCRHLFIACTDSGLYVPEDVAFLSFETDDLPCKVIRPPISGIDIPVECIGYEVARQLDLLMQGTPLAKKEITLPPVGITTRQSTDVFAVDDPVLQAVLRYLQAVLRFDALYVSPSDPARVLKGQGVNDAYH